jgi:pyruvate dehydrogenase E1 component beta subunit
MEKNDRTILFGQGVTDHVGILGTTLNLEEAFGSDRVFETPLAEDSMTGFALGASLSGLSPIHIHIRTDFMLLAMNQLVNSIAKYRYMYGGLFATPMLIRSIIGRSWGQGAQHSQSLQALFAHIPGIYVVMPSSARTAYATYMYANSTCVSPVISLEHRLLYDYSFDLKDDEDEIFNPFTSYMVRQGGDVTIVATSIMVEEAIRAANFVQEMTGLDVDIIDLHCISHPDENLIIESVRKTGRLIVADTGWESFGVCAEVARIIASREPNILRAPIRCLSLAKAPCPTAHRLEHWYYPDMANLVDSIYSLCFDRSDHGKQLPSEEYVKEVHKTFKGPF